MNTETTGSVPGGAPEAPMIYAVDDNEMILTVLEDTLKLQGYRVRAFGDPREALRAFNDASPKPDLLVSDFLMGQMDGLELIALCKKVDPALRTILCSGSVGTEIFADQAAKPDRFLGKPFLPRQLMGMIAELLCRPTGSSAPPSPKRDARAEP